jgi:hypothetical protein
VELCSQEKKLASDFKTLLKIKQLPMKTVSCFSLSMKSRGPMAQGQTQTRWQVAGG